MAQRWSGMQFASLIFLEMVFPKYDAYFKIQHKGFWMQKLTQQDKEKNMGNWKQRGMKGETQGMKGHLIKIKRFWTI